MTSEMSKKEWNNIIQQFAYRKSEKCIKLHEFEELIGGNYTWNTWLYSKSSRVDLLMISVI